MKKVFIFLSLGVAMGLVACGSGNQSGNRTIGRAGAVSATGAGAPPSNVGTSIANSQGSWVQLQGLTQQNIVDFVGSSVTLGNVATGGCTTLNGYPCGVYINVAQSPSSNIFSPPVLVQSGSTYTSSQGVLTVQIFDSLTGNGTSQVWATMNMNSASLVYQATNSSTAQNTMTFDTGVNITGNLNGSAFSGQVGFNGSESLGSMSGVNICQIYACNQ